MRHQKILKTIINELVYGGHLQSLGAASIVFTACILLNLKISWHILLAVYLIFYTIYIFDRFKDFKKDALTNSKRTQHIKHYFKFIPAIIIFTILITGFLLLYFASISALIFGIILLIFGLLYPIIFKNLTKQIPAFKNFYVSLFFASLVFFAITYNMSVANISSFAYYSAKITKDAFILSSFVFLKSFLIQIFLDIKDIKNDKKEKLLTIPNLIGAKKSFFILQIFTLFIVLFLSLYFSLIFLLLIPFNFYCFAQAKKNNYLGYILAGSEFVLWSILVLFSKIVI